MNRLKGVRCYLAGPMDLVLDRGTTWRKMIQQELADFEIQFFDPTNKTCTLGIENESTRNLIHNAKAQGDFDRVAEILRPIRRVDLRMISLSDFLIVFLDKDNNGFGTIEEISSANQQMKPVLICQEDGKHLAANWLFGMVPHEHIFGSWDGLIAYVRHVASDPIVDSMNRWYFFNERA